MFLHCSGGEEENKVAMEQYLSKYLFEKYVSTPMKPESVSSMVDYTNITVTMLRIICNYIRDVFGKCAILLEEALHNLGTGYMDAEYRTYEYEKKKGTEKEHINFWYIQAECILTLRTLALQNDCSCHFWKNHPQFLPPFLVQFL